MPRGREGTPVLSVVNADGSTESGSLLDEIARKGVRRILAAASETEVHQYIAELATDTDGTGRRLVVRNGHHRPRTVTTAAGPDEVTAPRVPSRRSPTSGRNCWRSTTTRPGRGLATPRRERTCPQATPQPRRRDRPTFRGDLHRDRIDLGRPPPQPDDRSRGKPRWLFARFRSPLAVRTVSSSACRSSKARVGRAAGRAREITISRRSGSDRRSAARRRQSPGHRSGRDGRRGPGRGPAGVHTDNDQPRSACPAPGDGLGPGGAGLRQPRRPQPCLPGGAIAPPTAEGAARRRGSSGRPGPTGLVSRR